MKNSWSMIYCFRCNLQKKTMTQKYTYCYIVATCSIVYIIYTYMLDFSVLFNFKGSDHILIQVIPYAGIMMFAKNIQELAVNAAKAGGDHPGYIDF